MPITPPPMIKKSDVIFFNAAILLRQI
jgi:hypothetical protein